jgi:hypothetical protein
MMRKIWGSSSEKTWFTNARPMARAIMALYGRKYESRSFMG